MKTLRISVLAVALFAAAVPQVYAQSADRLNAQSVQLYRQGKYQEALSLAEKVVEMRRLREKEEPAEFATSLNNLAALYQDMGVYGKAEPIYQRALAIIEKVLGP